MTETQQTEPSPVAVVRYLAVMDESVTGGSFSSGGFVAPESIWSDYFVPAWNERVLAGKPSLKYLHMIDARDSDWRSSVGISNLEMDRRLDEAARVIGSTGPLALIGVTLSAEQMRQQLGSAKVVMPTRQPGVYAMEADYIAFLNFVYVTLIWIDVFAPDAERVDFLVERKQDITRRFHYFFKDIGESLQELGMLRGADLVGELREGGKESSALQAVDYMLWHRQRRFAGRASARDLQRWNTIIDSRLGHWHDVGDEAIAELGASAKLNSVADPRKKGREHSVKETSD